MKQFVALVFVCALINSCTKDNEGPTTVTLFTMTTEATVDRAGNDDWFVVVDHETGDIIDYKNVKPGQTIKFESDKSIAKIDVTWFAAQEYTIQSPGTQRSYEVSVYTGLDPGTEWTLKGLSNSSVTPPTVIGHYNLSATGIPSDYALTYSDKYGSITSYGVAYPSPGYFILHANAVEIRSNATTHMVCVDPGFGNPKYLLLEGLKDSDNIVKSYADFKEFDKIVTVNFPEAIGVGLEMAAFDGPVTAESNAYNGFMLTNNRNFSNAYKDWSFLVPRQSINLGFLNSFSNYVVQLGAGGFSYSLRGPAPTAINYIDPSAFNITDRGLTTFNVSTSQGFTRRTVSYSYNELNETGGTTYVSVSFNAGPNGAQHHQPLSPELLQQFSINMSKLKFAGATFVIKGETYPQFTASAPTYLYPASSFERITVTAL